MTEALPSVWETDKSISGVRASVSVALLLAELISESEEILTTLIIEPVNDGEILKVSK